MSVKTGTKRYQEKPGGQFIEGNPGKPKGVKHMTTKLIEAITRVSEGGEDSADVQIVKALIEGAKKGQDKKIELIMHYIDGKPPAAPEDPGSPENPINHVHTVVWD